MTEEHFDYITHWNKAYSNSEENKLGWYETDLSPTLRLIEKTGLDKSARILNIGAGSTTLIDKLLSLNYTNLIATDISEIALTNLANRVNSNYVTYIIDDLLTPNKLKNIDSVDLWIDRAVLHFFTEEKDQNTYFDLLKSKIKTNSYVLIAEFNLDGATKCSALPVHRYSLKMISDKLGNGFELIDSFNYTFTNPNGDERPYIYTLFKKK